MSNKTKILIAIDSFKNSISSADAALNLEEGILSASSNIEVFRIPVADGGEGTVEAVIESVGGEYIVKKVNDRN
jgi:glycerate kinase